MLAESISYADRSNNWLGIAVYIAAAKQWSKFARWTIWAIVFIERYQENQNIDGCKLRRSGSVHRRYEYFLRLLHTSVLTFITCSHESVITTESPACICGKLNDEKLAFLMAVGFVRFDSRLVA